MASQDWFDKDFYKILGVAKDVSEAELKKVYRKLARQFHPDSNPGDAKAEAKFKEISEAYSVLSDPAQRKEYDAVKAMGGGARFRSGGPGQSGGFEDIFGDIFGGGQRRSAGFPGGFENMFGGGFRGPQPGQDLSTSTKLSFIDSVNGSTIKVNNEYGVPITVKVPAGVQNGQKIKLRGKGMASSSGGPNGDLIVTVEVKPHPVFSRDGNNLRVTVPVTIVEAMLGATVEVPTLGGDPVKIKVAAGTPNGRVIRIKGKGVPTPRGDGDLLATVEVLVPERISSKAEAALREFAKELPDDNVRADLLSRAGLIE